MTRKFCDRCGDEIKWDKERKRVTYVLALDQEIEVANSDSTSVVSDIARTELCRGCANYIKQLLRTKV